jgi:hypothetical protein
VLTEEPQAARPVQILQLFEEAPSEQARQHANGQEESRPAGDPTFTVGRQATAGDDAMDVRVVCQ